MIKITSDDRREVLSPINDDYLPHRLNRIEKAALLAALSCMANLGVVETDLTDQEEYRGFSTEETLEIDYDNVNFSDNEEYLSFCCASDKKAHYFIPSELSTTGDDEQILTMFVNDNRIILYTFSPLNMEDKAYEVQLVL